MTVEEYINIVPYKDHWIQLSDEEKANYISYSKLILLRHYLGLDFDTVDALYPQLVAEEAIYIAENELALKSAYSKYEGLKKMEVKNAVMGEVWTDFALSELSDKVRQIAQLLGLEEMLDLTGRINPRLRGILIMWNRLADNIIKQLAKTKVLIQKMEKIKGGGKVLLTPAEEIEVNAAVAGAVTELDVTKQSTNEITIIFSRQSIDWTPSPINTRAVLNGKTLEVSKVDFSRIHQQPANMLHLEVHI